ncbi:MAG TPA: alpha/beta hydrolase [Gemmatimonadales bacterium]|nr:alpha/beta hydrolase [Gemmatimonadales bacterium]
MTVNPPARLSARLNAPRTNGSSSTSRRLDIDYKIAVRSNAFGSSRGSFGIEFMAQSQVPWGLNALNGEVTEASWRTKPSWYLVATDDRMIPPAAQRFMSKRAGATVVESPGSHAIYVSRPAPVVALIEQAANAVGKTASR